MVVLGRDGSIQGFAPQALGERVPQITNGYFYADTGINLLGKFQEYAALYRSQPVVATLVDKIANSAARLSPKVYNVSDPKGRTEQPDSAFAKLLREPCRTMSAFNFYRWTFSTYEVLGEAFWLKVRDNTGAVVTLEPMHPERVSIKRAIDGTVTYIFSIGVASAGILEVPAEDVVAFQRYNPDNTMRGLSRLEQLRVTLLNEDAARRANSAFWKNGARPSVVLTHPDSLSRDAMDKISAQFAARHQGADNFGGVPVLEEGMTLTPTTLNNDEMEYIESRKLNMQEVCMVFDVPPPVVHILDHATYSNITEQMRSMYRDTMSPRLEDYESVIDFSLRSEFYPDGGYEAEFDMTEVLRGDFETRATTAAALRQGGVVTGNEARDIIGLEQSDDAEMDKVYVSSAMVELGTKPPAPGGTDPSGASATDPARVPGDELLDGKPAPDAAKPGADDKPSKPVLGRPSAAAKAIERAILGEAGRALKAGKLPADLKQSLVDQHVKTLKPYFEDQKAAARKGEFGPKAPARKGLLRVATKDTTEEFFDEGGFDDSFEADTYGWNDQLAGLLGTLSLATAKAIGRLVARDLGSEDSYDASDITDLLKAESARAAKRINRATYQQIAEGIAAAALDQAESDFEDEGLDPMIDSVYDGLTGDNPYRLSQMANTRTQQVGLTAGMDAADTSGARTKEWCVNSTHPRESHAGLDGEVVGLGEAFSNGMLGPGDIVNGGVDEVAGCNCTLKYGLEALEALKSLGLKYSDDEARDDHGRWTSDGGGDGGGEAESPADAAQRIYSDAVKAEPAITSAMQAASAAHGGTLVGLDFRVKTPGSLQRKIEADAAANGVSVTDAANAVSDANRYTMEFSKDDYTKGAEATLDDLKAQGYSERVKNFWPDGDPYQGINAALKTPDGQNVELQFHTADSFEVKETLNHPLYEEFRTSTDSSTRRSLWDRMVANARTIPVPSGVLNIPTLRVQTL